MLKGKTRALHEGSFRSSQRVFVLKHQFYLRVSSWGNKVEAAVHSGVGDSLLSGDVHLFFQELLKLLIDVLRNGFPAAGHKKHDAAALRRPDVQFYKERTIRQENN